MAQGKTANRLAGLITLLCLACAAGFTPAQDKDAMVPHAAGLVVADVQKAADWYQTYLGFKPFHRMTSPDQNVQVVLLERDGFILEMLGGDAFISPASLDAKATDRGDLKGWVKIALPVQEIRKMTAQLDRSGARLMAGVTFDRVFGAWFNLFRDPEGNVLQLFQSARPADPEGKKNKSERPNGPFPAFALNVASLDRMAEWYVRQFGFIEMMRFPTLDGRGREAYLKKGPCVLELIEKDGLVDLGPRRQEGPPPRTLQGLLKVGYLVEDLEGWLGRLQSAGVTILRGIATDKPISTRYFLCQDPEGNTIQIFQRTSGPVFGRPHGR